MTDRKLLEMAAKAAGLNDFAWYTNPVFGHSYPVLGHITKPWNPLTDDGDALRLAVKLLLTVEVEDGFTEVLTGSGMEITESHKEDSLLATRRAIVRAAAEIGRAM